MFVLVHHEVNDPGSFWSRSQQALGDLPAGFELHHCLSASDGTLATCLWSAPSVDAIQSFLEPIHAGNASNHYKAAENQEGIAVPPQFQIVTPPVA